VQLAENLLSILPKNQSRIFYSDNGSTAVEVALKMAIQFWSNAGQERKRIICFEHAYHGDTFGAMSVSARSPFTNAFERYLFEVSSIPVPLKGEEEKSIQALKELLEMHGDDCAAFIFEPLVLGAGGMLMYEAAALDQLIALCKSKNIFCIADEVMTGFARTGGLFASYELHHQPDIICLSKGLTGGTMALGVTSCTAEIFDAFLSSDKMKTFFHGHSFTANPLACAAANASFDLLMKEDSAIARSRIATAHQDFVHRYASHPRLKNLRCKGSILAMELQNEEESTYLNSLGEEMKPFFLQQGILLRPIGKNLDVLPPYCITEEELQLVYDAISAYIAL
jgi:adenosylmethionine-8-amino-7-oxononanoate aminotransferase